MAVELISHLKSGSSTEGLLRRRRAGWRKEMLSLQKKWFSRGREANVLIFNYIYSRFKVITDERCNDVQGTLWIWVSKNDQHQKWWFKLIKLKCKTSWLLIVLEDNVVITNNNNSIDCFGLGFLFFGHFFVTIKLKRFYLFYTTSVYVLWPLLLFSKMSAQ